MQPARKSANQPPPAVISDLSRDTKPIISSTGFRKQMFKTNLPPTVWMLGAVMCLVNISFVVVYSLSALYLTASLGVSTIWVGLLEGVVEAISFVLKLCSGLLSDYLRRRKSIMVIGYFMTTISKPILALSSSFAIVFMARLFERVGNGLQATPRDAMVSDVAPADKRGSSFGMMRTLGTAGSVLGGVLGYYAMKHTNNNFQQVFWVATIPAFVAFFLLSFFVKEPKSHVDSDGKVIPLKTEKRPIHLNDIFNLGRPYWVLMIAVAVFMLARISETMMVLHAHNNFGLDKTYAPLIMSAYNITYSLSCYPCGLIADRYGRRAVLIFGILALVISDMFLWQATSLSGVFVGVFIWGIQLGVVHNTFVSMIADLIQEDLRGTAIGIYYLIGAVSSLAAGVGGGYIADCYGVESAFLFSLIIATCALLTLLVFIPKPQKKVAVCAN